MGPALAGGEKHVADKGPADTSLYARRPIMVIDASLARVLSAGSRI